MLLQQLHKNNKQQHKFNQLWPMITESNNFCEKILNIKKSPSITIFVKSVDVSDVWDTLVEISQLVFGNK
ncbi:hypothetical protein DOY81_005778 [Sarcophaga bullata]|nr:hypothetical protein DOY81_005778 [Sarcophaga bullata]